MYSTECKISKHPSRLLTRIMKLTNTLKSFLIIAFLSCFSIANAQTSNYVGLWEGTSQGELGKINMSETGFAYFIIKGDTFGGESFNIGEVNASLVYEINQTTSPNTIDFIVIEKTTKQEIRRLVGIIKQDDLNTITINISFGQSTRPTEFTEEDSMTLKRVSQP